MRIMIWGMTVGLLCAYPTWACTADSIEPGTRFELRQSYETKDMRGDFESGSSHGHSTLIEQVVALRDGGIELVYDEVDASNRRQWQFPIRVFKPANGALVLLNAAELEASVDPWLAKANWTREICAQWIFTWNAFKIDCDPQSALEIVNGYSLWHDTLRAEMPFQTEGLKGAPPLKLERSDANGSVYVVTGSLDPELLKLKKAETAVIVARISGEVITQEKALESLVNVEISGTITVRFVVALSGLVVKRIDQTEVRTTEAGEVEVSTATTTLERRRLQ